MFFSLATLTAAGCSLLLAAAPPSASSKTKTTPSPLPAQAPQATKPPPAVAVVEPPAKPKADPVPTVAPHALGKPKLMVLDLTSAGGVDAQVASSLTEAVAAAATKANFFEVTTQKDVGTALGIERQRQLVGCADDATSCLAELAGALGAPFALYGSVAQLGDAYQLSLQGIDARKAQPVGRSTRIANDLKALRNAIPYALAEATGTPPPEPPSKALPVTLMAVGGTAIATGGVLFITSLTREEAALNELNLANTQPSFQLKPASYFRDEAAAIRTQRILSISVAAAGAAALAAGIWLMPSSSDSGTGFAFVPTGTGAAWVGVFP